MIGGEAHPLTEMEKHIKQTLHINRKILYSNIQQWKIMHT